MGQPYVENANDVFNPLVNPTDWLELIDSASSPSETHMSNDGQEATLVGYIPWNKQRSALEWFLGFAYVDGNYVLHRENPEAHPVFPWLYASEVSLKPFNPAVNLLNPIAPLQFVSPWFGNNLVEINVANHRLSICNVRFRSFRYSFLDDSAITSPSMEFYRNVYLEIDPSVEALSCDGISQLVFAESAGELAEGPTPGVTPFPAPLAQLLSKARFTMNWLNVPFEFLSSATSYFYPENIIQCIGLLNSQPFPAAAPSNEQFLPGTLLMDAPKFSQKVFPVAATNPSSPLISIDVAIPFQYFQPPKGNVTSSYNGHNLMPWRGAPGDSTGGKYFYATRGGGTGDPPLLGSIDFNQIFTSPNA